MINIKLYDFPQARSENVKRFLITFFGYKHRRSGPSLYQAVDCNRVIYCCEHTTYSGFQVMFVSRIQLIVKPLFKLFKGDQYALSFLFLFEIIFEFQFKLFTFSQIEKCKN